MLILTKLIDIVFPTAAWNEERQSSANVISDAEQDKAREVSDELNADNKESLSEDALHSDLSDNTASAEGELDEGKTTQLVQSSYPQDPRRTKGLMKGRNTAKNTLTSALRPRIARRATQQMGSIHPLPRFDR